MTATEPKSFLSAEREVAINSLANCAEFQRFVGAASAHAAKDFIVGQDADRGVFRSANDAQIDLALPFAIMCRVDSDHNRLSSSSEMTHSGEVGLVLIGATFDTTNQSALTDIENSMGLIAEQMMAQYKTPGSLACSGYTARSPYVGESNSPFRNRPIMAATIRWES